MTRLIQTNEPKCGLIHATAYSEQAMVLQNARLALAKRFPNPNAFFRVQHDALEVAVHRMRLVEAQRVLRHHIQLAAKYREGFPIDGMRVAGGVYVWPRLVNLGVDGEGSRVDGLVADNDFAFLIDEDKVRHADLRKVLRKRVEPCEFWRC